MKTFTNLNGQGQVRPATNRIVASLIALLAFLALSMPTFAQGSSSNTTVPLSKSANLESQINIENILSGQPGFSGASMEAHLVNSTQLYFSVSGLEATIEEGQIVAVVDIVSDEETISVVIQGGGGGGGYIIGIEDL